MPRQVDLELHMLLSGLNIPLATLKEQPKLAVVIDGADEVDPELNVVKGRGGALLREKACVCLVVSLPSAVHHSI